MSEKKLIKFTVTLPEEELLLMQYHAAKDNISTTETIRRAFAEYNFLHNKLNEGFSVLVEDRFGRMYEVNYHY